MLNGGDNVIDNSSSNNLGACLIWEYESLYPFMFTIFGLSPNIIKLIRINYLGNNS